MCAVDFFKRFNFSLQLLHCLLYLGHIVYSFLLEVLVDLFNVVFAGSLQDSQSAVFLADFLSLVIGQALLRFKIVYFFVNFNLRFGFCWVEKFFLHRILF